MPITPHESVIPDNTAECKHSYVTLCQGYSDTEWFAAYQCDECGWITNQDPPSETLQAGDDLPHIDMPMWEASIERNLRRMLRKDEPAHNAIGFFARAMHGGK